jgi:hypothetical protein
MGSQGLVWGVDAEMTENHASGRWLAAGFVAGGALLVLTLLLAAAQLAGADLPPRPTVEEPAKRSASR